jgi:hypothetical protein
LFSKEGIDKAITVHNEHINFGIREVLVKDNLLYGGDTGNFPTKKLDRALYHSWASLTQKLTALNVINPKGFFQF